MEMRTALRVFLPLIALAFASPAVLADGVGVKAGPPVLAAVHSGPTTYGTSDEVSLTFAAADFAKQDETVTWATIAGATGFGMYQTSVNIRNWWQGIHIPNGAIIDSAELEACDTSATGEVLFGMAAGASPMGAAANITSIAGTGAAATPGCNFFTVTPTAPPVVVDNRNANYWVFMGFSGDFSGATYFNAIRVFYHLQISSAPVTPTFTDVAPDNIYYQFIEALAASGATGGCNQVPLQYCPDRPITRAEMSVFLAKLLGLHFPN
jgi:hypothetical protein